MTTRLFIYFLIIFLPKLLFGQIPNDIKTPQGHSIKFKITDKEFYIQWESNDTLRTLDYPFPLNPADAWLPRLISENDNYLFLRAGCGNPCWIGIFLPLYKNGKPKIINEYIAVDLNANLVASVKNSDSIEILHLQSANRQYFRPGKCESAFLGYCIDTAYFKGNTLHYNWTPETFINSRQRHKFEYKLKK